MTTVINMRPGVSQLSLPFQKEEGIIGPYLLAEGNELALIDPGPGNTVEALLDALRQAGYAPEAVTHILLTHIHLDHAGGVGSLLPHTPKARVYVHELGASHLVDPSKLISSATRIYGSAMQDLWGDVLPVPDERVKVVEDGDTLKLAGRRLEVHYTPGHANHHMIFFDVHSGELFAGDIAGVRLQETSYVRPPTPPPDLDLEAWMESIAKIRHLHPDLLYLAHFGPTDRPAQHLGTLREKLYSWGELTLRALREGKNEEEIIALLKMQTLPEFQRAARDEHELARYDLATNYPMTVQGYIRYWKKHHHERL